MLKIAHFMHSPSPFEFMGLNFSSLDYERYLVENPIHEFFDGLRPHNPSEKIIHDPNFATTIVDTHSEVHAQPSNDIEYDDLVRLHYITRIRKVSTILEFGMGNSTVVFADALLKNKSDFHQQFVNTLRYSNLFECHSIENYTKWIENCKELIPQKFFEHGISHIHKASLKMGTFSGRVCTYYDPLPDITPDLIYIDGPDQYAPTGNVRGITTRVPNRMPMAADVLSIEHFLTPGTLIIIDGRTANARFLKSNLQRNWDYFYAKDFDQHFFELLEEPLGIYNQEQINICLGNSYFDRLKKFSV